MVASGRVWVRQPVGIAHRIAAEHIQQGGGVGIRDLREARHHADDGLPVHGDAARHATAQHLHQIGPRLGYGGHRGHAPGKPRELPRQPRARRLVAHQAALFVDGRAIRSDGHCACAYPGQQATGQPQGLHDGFASPTSAAEEQWYTMDALPKHQMMSLFSCGL